MLQKTIWTHFLTTGISIIVLSLFFSCGKEIIERIKTVSYTYKNETGKDLTMEIYNSSDNMFKSFKILNNSEVTTHITQIEVPALFYFESTEDKIGDSVIVKFNDNKCIYYTNKIPDKIFNIKEYDNYSDELLKKSKYTLHFTFEEVDYNNSTICN